MREQQAQKDCASGRNPSAPEAASVGEIARRRTEEE
jgi:hypothetical protein